MFQKFYLPFIRVLLVILVIVQSSNCTRKPEIGKSVSPKYNPDISAFTSGVISNESRIKIRLSEAFPGEPDTQNPIDKNLFEIKPSIPGKAYWIDNRTIEFRPDQKLASGVSYNVKFRLSKLFDSKKKSDFDFQFSTISLNAGIEVSGFRTYNRTDLIWNEIYGMLSTSDIVDAEDIEKIMNARQGNKILSVKWTHQPGGKIHAFTIDSVMRSDKREKIEIKWDGNVINTELQGSTEYEIPALGEFTLLQYKVIQQPEQYILLQFSDPLKTDQFLKGLINLENNTDLRFTIEGNEIKVYPVIRQGGTISLTIDEGIQNILSYKFMETRTITLDFESLKPAIRLVGNGAIIPESEGLIFPFEAVSLKAVDVKIIMIYENNIAQFLQINNLDGNEELKRAGRLIVKKTINLVSERAINYGEWNAFALDLSKLIQVSPGAIYRVELGFRKKHSLFVCPGTETEQNDDLTEINDEFEKISEDEIAYWDATNGYYSYDYEDIYSENYNYMERNQPCSDSYYGKHRTVARNILASNLGIIVKSGTDKSMLFAVTDLKTTEPISGVKLEVYNFQNILLSSFTTDNDGIVEVKLENQPFLLIAKKDKQRGYLKLDNGSSLSLSQFDVSGNLIKNGVKGFIYGERGVWRPGDTLYLNFILEDKSEIIPENHPVIMELWDASGKLYNKLIRSEGLNGFYHFRMVTDPDVPTGSWRAVVRVGGLEFSSLIRIETVKPNRLKINLNFGKDELSSNLNDNLAKLSVKWLHGAPAKDLKVTASVNLFPATTTFNAYDKYSFSDPVKSFYYTENEIFSGRLNENGEESFTPQFDVNNTSPGKLRANFTTRAFEKGGDFSIDQYSIIYSPYPVYLGLKAPDGDKNGILVTDTTQSFDVVTLSEDGNPVDLRSLEVRIYKLDWRWWWNSTAENLASFVSSPYSKPVFDEIISTKAGKGKFIFRLSYPDWGRFLVRINDTSGKHSAGKIVYFDWPGWVNRSSRKDPEAARILAISSDRTKYNVGETANITIPTGEEGRAFVSIENGTKVIDHYWIKTSGKESRFSFNLTEVMTPNVYVNVTLIQPHAQTKNDLPIRMYGVIPIYVEDPVSRLQPFIDVPEVLRPESSVVIKISEKNKREMTYTLAIVDEGLLDLTRFQTPDPWNTFYAKEALGVKTFDLYDLVLGTYGGRIDGVFGIGGGEDESGPQGQVKANRFKPMVKFTGPFFLGNGKTDLHTINIPNYIGSVKFMAVAGYKGAYGNTNKVAPVRKPLMILTSLPRVIGPGEKLNIPVNIFAMEEQIKNVNLSIEANQMFNIISKEKSLRFDAPGDMTVNFEAGVADDPGIGKIRVLATSGREEAREELEIDVRSPNPMMTDFYYGILDPGKNWEKDFILPGIKGTNTGELEVSSLPPVDFGRRLKYLLEYPYGCLEQITSIVFPQLFLGDVMDINENFRNIIDRNIKAGIQSIQKFQLTSGGLGLWPNSRLENDWGTSYAGHFMHEAQKKGYSISRDWIKNWIRYQKNEAKKWSPDKYESRWQQNSMELCQAYRLYSLAVSGEPELGAMNRMREKIQLGVAARWMLASAYAIAGQKESSMEMVKSLTTEITDYQDTRYTYGSELRDKGFILETMGLLNIRDEAVPVLQYISEKLTGESWYSTQTTAVCLMAVAKFAGSGKISSGLNYEFSLNGAGLQKAATKNPYSQIKIDFEKRSDGKVKVSNKGEGIIFVRLALHGIPKAGQEKNISRNLNMSIKYKDMTGNIIDIESMEQGTDFIAEVTINNPGVLDYYNNLALTQIFPSGWEIQNLRLFESNIGSYSSPIYQDYRDDRVYTFLQLGKNESKTFAVKLNAAYIGRFYLPGTKCEEMYRNDIQAAVQGTWVEVVKSGK